MKALGKERNLIMNENEKPTQKVIQKNDHILKDKKKIKKNEDSSDLNSSLDIEPDVMKATMYTKDSDLDKSLSEEEEPKDVELFTIAEYKKECIKNMFNVVSEYAVDDSGFYCKTQYRNTLLDWLIRIHEEFGFEDETLYLSISIFDRICRTRQIKRCHYQLFAATSMWIASKLEETQTPALSDFIYLCDNAYKEREFCDCERVICGDLGYGLVAPTPRDFILPISAKGKYKNIAQTAEFFLKVSTYSEIYQFTEPQVIAVAVLYIACTMNKEELDCLEELGKFHIKRKVLSAVVNEIIETYTNLSVNGSECQQIMINEGLESLPVSLEPIGKPQRVSKHSNHK